MIAGLTSLLPKPEQTQRSTSLEQIAKLTEADLQLLSDHELLTIVRAVKIPFINETQVETQERPTLIKLAILARNACAVNLN